MQDNNQLLGSVRLDTTQLQGDGNRIEKLLEALNKKITSQTSHMSKGFNTVTRSIQAMQAETTRQTGDMVAGFELVTEAINEMQAAMARGNGGRGRGNGGVDDNTQALRLMNEELNKYKHAQQLMLTATRDRNTADAQYWESRRTQIRSDFNDYSQLFDMTIASEAQLHRLDDLMQEMSTINLHGNLADQAARDAQAYGNLREHVAGLKGDYQKMNDARKAGNATLAQEYETSAQNHQAEIDATEARLRSVVSLTDAQRRQLELVREAQLIQAKQSSYETAQADRSSLDVQKKDLETMRDLYRNLNTEVQRYYLQLKQGAGQADLDATRGQIESIYSQMGAIAGRSFGDQHIGNQIADTFDKAGVAVGNFEYKISHIEKEFKGLYGTTTKLGDSFAKAADKATKLTTALAIAGLAKMWKSAVDYVKEYDNALNEIRIVTYMTQEQAEAVGDRIRDLAKELKTTSAELAGTAADIYRQGVTDDAEVLARLEQVTKFSQISGLDTDTALETMTATINNFKKEGESVEGVATRIADAWAYMGDAVASDASDIGIAMQRTAASAAEVGLSIEKTSSYIAVISAKTRESAETIGTSINSIISRYTKITSAGMNKIFEDEDGEMIAVNDVAKALEKAGIEMYNAQTGFMSFGDILDTLYMKWGSLDVATQRYIATQFAGTRNLNRFTALMEGYGQTLDLVSGAIENAGVADEKHAIYMESAQAASANLKASLEDLYSILQADVIKGWTNNLVGFVAMLGRGSDAMNGWNIMLPGMIGMVSVFGLKIQDASGKIATFGQVAKVALSFLNAHPIGAFITVLGLLVSLFSLAADGFGRMTGDAKTFTDEIDEMNTAVTEAQQIHEEWKNSTKNIKNLRDRYVELAGKTKLTTEEEQELDGIIRSIANVSDECAFAVTGMTDAFEKQEEVVSALNKALDDTNKKYSAIQAAKIEEGLSGVPNALLGMTGELDRLKGEQITGPMAAFEKEFSTQALNISGGGMNTDLFTLQSSGTEILDEMFGGALPSREAAEAYIDQWIDESGAWIDEENNKIKQWIEAMGVDVASLANELNMPDGNAGDILMYVIGETISMTGAEFYEAEQMIREQEEKIAAAFDDYKQTAEQAALAWLDPEDQIGVFGEAVKRQIAALFEGKDPLTMTGADYDMLEINRKNITNSIRRGYEEAKNSPEYAELIKAEEEWAEVLLDPERTAESIQKAADKLNTTTDAFNLKFGDNLGFNMEGIDDASISAEIDRMNAMREAVLPDIETYTATGRETGEAYVLAMLDGISEAMDKGGEFKEVFSQLLGSMAEDLDPEQFEEFSNVLQGIFGMDAEDIGGMSFTDFREQIEEAMAATAEGLSELFNTMAEEGNFEPTVENLESLYDLLEDTDGIDEFGRMWEMLSDDARKEVKKIAPELEDLYEGIEDGSADSEDAMKALNKTIAKMKLNELEDAGKILDGTADVFEDVTANGANAEKEIGSFISTIGDLKAAQEAYNYCIRDGASSMADYDTHMQTLANYAGVPVEALGDLSSVANMLTYDLAMAGNSASWLLNMMSSVAGVQLNTANWQGQLQAAADSGNVCAAAMLTLISYLQGIDGTIVNMFTSEDGTSAKFNVSGLGSGVKLPKVSTAKKSGGGGGGRSGGSGGGGGSSSIDVSDEITEMIERMDKALDLIDFNIELMQVAQEMHEVSGEIQSVILYTEKEIDATTKQRDTLKGYIAALEAEMAAKKKMMAANKATSKAYKQANVDLEELNKKHQELTLEYYKSETALKELEQALEDYRMEALEKVTTVQDLILEAIEDREALEESMLEGRIDLENEIMDLLKERYEKERDEILETQEAKREALEEEMDLLDEMLDKRKEAAKMQERETEIARLEAQIARISADPTRKKEELELRKELAELRDELAWETAENEVEAQKDALEQQIDSIDEYMEYVEKYYDDLFENPKKLIEEMQQIIQGTDEEIMNWLQENSEEFREATEATQESMTTSWQETLNEMRGVTETYWDEVQQIMQGTDEEILAFLKEHNQDFKEASSEQAKIFVGEWRNALEEWRSAYKAATDAVSSYNYAPTVSVSGGSGGGGGGGSTVGGALAGAAAATVKKKTYYRYAYKKIDGSWAPMGTYDATEKEAFARAQKGGQNYWQMLADSGQLKQSAADNFKNLIASATISNPGKYIKFSDTKQFKTGGMADFTGLAWLDGTKSKPERILSAYQTELFEDLLETLHAIKMLRVSLPSMSSPEYSGEGYGVNIERIDITTNSLTEDADFDEITRRVGEAIEAAMMKGSTVGGIRVRRG